MESQLIHFSGLFPSISFCSFAHSRQTYLKPPTGVVNGPLIATLNSLIAFNVSSGNTISSPYFLRAR